MTEKQRYEKALKNAFLAWLKTQGPFIGATKEEHEDALAMVGDETTSWELRQARTFKAGWDARESA